MSSHAIFHGRANVREGLSGGGGEDRQMTSYAILKRGQMSERSYVLHSIKLSTFDYL